MGLSELLDPMTAGAANITYSDDAEVSDEDAERICDLDLCIDHGSGTAVCPVPETWGELRDAIDENDDLSLPGDRRDVEPDAETYRAKDAVDVDDLNAQPVPDVSTCPYCGGDATEDSVVKHRLSAMGYKHDDIELECDGCGQTWPHGVPIGEYDGKRAEELFCGACEERYMLVHRVEPSWSKADTGDWEVLVHLKCPNCYYFKKIARECGPRGVALMGYPQITGDTEGAEPDGYRSPDDV